MIFTVDKPGKLSARLSDRSVSYFALQKLLRRKDVKVNGKRVSADVELAVGDVVEVFYRPEAPVVYEDDNLIVCDKPKNMECAGEGTLESFLAATRPCVIACHRLDRNTEGLVLYAKSEAAEREVARLLAAGDIRKYYECILVSRQDLPPRRETAYLVKDAARGRVRVFREPRPGAKPIATQVRTLERVNEELLRAEVLLETGRTHQIRAHLAFLGTPVLGDEKYGDFAANRKYKKSTQMLRATRIFFSQCEGLLADLSGRTLTSRRVWKL